MHIVLIYSYVGARSIQGMDIRVQFARRTANKLFSKIAKSDVMSQQNENLSYAFTNTNSILLSCVYIL
jgi:hypothetical protein